VFVFSCERESEGQQHKGDDAVHQCALLDTNLTLSSFAQKPDKTKQIKLQLVLWRCHLTSLRAQC
jgi:hypothetical protein